MKNAIKKIQSANKQKQLNRKIGVANGEVNGETSEPTSKFVGAMNENNEIAY